MSGEFSFAAETMQATSAAAALRRIRALAEGAPPEFLIEAIATLNDLSSRIQANLEAGQEAVAAGAKDQATLTFAQALVQMNTLTREATSPLPVPLEELREAYR